MGPAHCSGSIAGRRTSVCGGAPHRRYHDNDPRIAARDRNASIGAHCDSNHISRQILIALPLFGRRQTVMPRVDTFLKLTRIGI